MPDKFPHPSGKQEACVIIHAYGKLEAGLHTGGTVDAFKRVIVYLLPLTTEAQILK